MTIPPGQASSTPSRFRYDGATMRALYAAISSERLTRYLKLAEGDKRRALQQYAYNAALGSAFHGPLQALEVTLRNAVHIAITEERGVNWFDGPGLEQPQQDAVRNAKEDLRWERGPQDPGRIVAGLSFGFWVALFAKRYEKELWRPVLHQCFNPRQDRRRLHDRLNRLRRLRNRIVHHEPILHWDLRADHDLILWVLDLLSPETRNWVEHHSRVPGVLDQPAHQVRYF